MILVYILIAGCVIFGIGIGVGFVLRIRRMDQENKEMEAILKKYGKNSKDTGAGNTRDGGDIPHRL